MAYASETSFGDQKSSPDFSPVTGEGIGAPGGPRLRTLLLLRWTAIVGQFVAVNSVWFGLGYSLPLIGCLAVIAASALLNISQQIGAPQARRLTDHQARIHFIFDTVQLAALLYLTGGLTNPFALLFLVPVTVSASALSTVSALIVGVVAVGCISLLAVVHHPLPWGGSEPVTLPTLYLFGIWAAMVIACVFAAFFTRRLAQESRRMANALATLQQALAREQELAAIGGLAAAAAHELGTPLATISIVAKELQDELSGDDAMSDDLCLLHDQSERCREILADLGRERAAVHAQPIVPLAILVDEVCRPFAGAGVTIERAYIVEGREVEPGETRQFTVRRRPELLYALRNIIDNSVGFARETIRIAVQIEPVGATLRIRDDGPGFPADILSRLGDPYVSSRGGDGGMGLGMFISKTLLERTGGEIDFRNLNAPGAGGGAEVVIAWPRDILIENS